MRQAVEQARKLEHALARQRAVLEWRARRQFSELRDDLRFSLEWAAKPMELGAVSPSGKPLARMMAAQVDPQAAGLVVELGPGTGVITKALIERGVAQEHLLLIEYNPDFADMLRRRFPRARVITGDAYNIANLLPAIAGDTPIAAIVSGLPLFTRPAEQRRKLVRDALALIGGATGAFIQFSYALVPPVPRDPWAYTLRGTKRVWWNLFPARVWVYRRSQ